MTPSNQIPREVGGVKKWVLNTKTKLKFGFWNVRTMFEAGKLAQITKEMRRYNLNILGISDARWTDSGSIKTNTGETVLYSGRDDDRHHEGVAIILQKGIEKSLIEWKPISNRIITARFKGQHNNLTVIQSYSPTNDAKEEEKDLFL